VVLKEHRERASQTPGHTRNRANADVALPNSRDSRSGCTHRRGVRHTVDTAGDLSIVTLPRPSVRPNSGRCSQADPSRSPLRRRPGPERPAHNMGFLSLNSDLYPEVGALNPGTASENTAAAWRQSDTMPSVGESSASTAPSDRLSQVRHAGSHSGAEGARVAEGDVVDHLSAGDPKRVRLLPLWAIPTAVTRVMSSATRPVPVERIVSSTITITLKVLRHLCSESAGAL
jgi:hypothetical protein